MLNPNLVFHERCANKLCTMSWHIFLCTMSRHLSPIPYSLPLCYNRRAVERTAKCELAGVHAEPAQAAAESVAPLQGSPSLIPGTEDPSRYCLVCSQRLESRRCKLLCSACGYYMSCADYY